MSGKTQADIRRELVEKIIEKLGKDDRKAKGFISATVSTVSGKLSGAKNFLLNLEIYKELLKNHEEKEKVNQGILTSAKDCLNKTDNIATAIASSGVVTILSAVGNLALDLGIAHSKKKNLKKKRLFLEKHLDSRLYLGILERYLKSNDYGKMPLKGLLNKVVEDLSK